MIAAVTVWAALTGPLLFAHRGAGREQAENTLPAFESALGAGADVLEIDVHMSRDGHVLVAHDPDGRRVAGIDRAIRDSSLAEIKRWDVSHSAPNHARRPARMPTLDEVLRAFPDALLNVDIKQREPDMTRALLQLLARHTAEGRVLLTSFDAVTTGRVRALGYRGPTGLARRDVAAALFLPRALHRLRAPGAQRMQIPLRAGALALDRRGVVERAHRLALAVDFWVVNDAAVAERLLGLGADGIVTDDPRGLAEVYARLPQTAAWRVRHGR